MKFNYLSLAILSTGLLTNLVSCKGPASAPPVVSIIPKPVSLQRTDGTFTIDAHTKVVLSDTAFRPSADFLNAYLDKYYGFELPVERIAKDK